MTTATAEVKQVRVIGTCGRVTSKLIAALKDGAPGDEQTHEDLADLAGGAVSVGERYYGNLQRALAHVARVYGVAWQNVRGEHRIRCMGVEERIATTRSGLKSTGRKARKLTHIIDGMDFRHATDAQKTQALVLAAQAGAVAVLSHGTTTQRLIDRKATATPPTLALLAAFATKE